MSAEREIIEFRMPRGRWVMVVLLAAMVYNSFRLFQIGVPDHFPSLQEWFGMAATTSLFVVFGWPWGSAIRQMRAIDRAEYAKED